MKSFKATDNETYVSILIQSYITVTRCTHTHTHTPTLSLVHNIREERTKKKEQIEIIFFLSIQKRGDLSTSCIRDYLSVTSYALCTDHFANDKLFPEKNHILFFFFYSKILLGYHQTPSNPYIRAVFLLLISATLNDVCSWGVSLYCKLL